MKTKLASLLCAVFIALAVRAEDSDIIGQKYFPGGDSIEIKSVERSPDSIVVKGEYNLISQGSALLALYITATNNAEPSTPAGEKQTSTITKGHGEFELIDPHPFSGLPHISMYGGDHHPFATVYFGTKEEAAAESSLNLSYVAPAHDIDSAPPVVIKTIPEAGRNDVSSGEYDVQVTFSKDMTDQSWSWSTAWENSTPEMIGKPHYEADHRTCVLKVKLEPGTTYGWWLNSQKFHNFRDAQGHSAVPYLLTFQTAEATASAVSGGTIDSDAKSAVQSWLALMDAGEYSQSWVAAADSFHTAVTKSDWVKLSQKVRDELGKLISRQEISTRTALVVPGMPPGAYYITQFESSFTGLPNAVETVIFSREVAGTWKAMSYVIRPRTAEQTAAVTAAQAWLAEIDAGNYAQSWTDAAQHFQGAITQDKWVAALESVRKPLGQMTVRTVDSTDTKTELPGAPDGKYVVMQFNTAYANKSSAVETVTFVLEKDGHWKADGYYIK